MKKLFGLFFLIIFASCSSILGEPQKRALIVVSSHAQLGNTGKKTGWFLSEVSHVYYPLIEAGFLVDFASPKGGEAPVDPKSIDLKDADNKKFVAEFKIIDSLETLELSNINPHLYEVVHFAGGHGTMWDFPGNPHIERVAAGVYENGGVVAAVCHGPAALVDVKLSNGNYLVAGKKVTPFSNKEEKEVGLTKVVPFLLEDRLRARGAEVEVAANWKNKVTVSDRLVTGQNPQSAATLGQEIVKLTRESHD